MAQRDEADRMVSRTPAGKRARRNAYPRRGPQGKPEITPEMRANARTNPNSWLYVIDEAFDARGPVPSWAVVGAYPVNGTGEVVEDFHPNDRYRPSPKALGFPEPRNELERLLQMVRTEHRPAEDLPRVILDSTLLVYALSPVQRTVIGFHNADGRVMVPAVHVEVARAARMAARPGGARPRHRRAARRASARDQPARPDHRRRPGRAPDEGAGRRTALTWADHTAE